MNEEEVSLEKGFYRHILKHADLEKKIGREFAIHESKDDSIRPEYPRSKALLELIDELDFHASPQGSCQKLTTILMLLLRKVERLERAVGEGLYRTGDSS